MNKTLFLTDINKKKEKIKKIFHFGDIYVIIVLVKLRRAPSEIRRSNMQSKYSIPLNDIIKEFQLESVYMPEGGEKIKVSSPEVSRPGLALSGFVEVFEPFRIQIIGKAEHRYLSEMTEEQRYSRLGEFFKINVSCSLTDKTTKVI